MRTSIAQRIFRQFFFVNLLFLIGILIFAWWALEDLEETMLASDRKVEVQYFADNGEKDKPQHIATGLLISAFIPHGIDENNYLPVLFEQIPVPYQGEIEFLGKEYSVVTQAFPEGNYYLAKDLQLFEEREAALTLYVLAMAVVIGAACYVLARLFSRRISQPVLRLAQAIDNIDSENTASRLDENFVDIELNAVAAAINEYRTRIDASVAREKNLISMASHELRTPVAVVLGAARIIERRNRIAPDDAKTLQRIISAAEEMTANIRTLLTLVRQGKHELQAETFFPGDLLAALCEDYGLEQPANAQRLHLVRNPQPGSIDADKALVRMLLHNLISNALHHTQGEVVIHEQPGCISVCDQGAADGKIPFSVHNDAKPSSSLGLYIVNLACEQLGWQLEIVDAGGGSCVNVRFSTTSNK